MLLAAERITKNYSQRMLLEEASFYLNEGEKIGVIGVNGAGKSTLLRIAAGLDEPDEGSLTRKAGMRIAYLPQEPVFTEDISVMEQVFLHVSKSETDLFEYEAKTILNKLDINDHDQLVTTLSGGQRKRVAIAAALVRPCDLLILDEPTNHLDSDMVQWLEEYLIRFGGAILMVTHDRYFLERVVGRILEIDSGRLTSCDGNYEAYLALKERQAEMAGASERKRQAILKKELAWLMRGARARSTKSKGRIERYEALRDREARPEREKLELRALSARLGRKTIELHHISKAYGDRRLIRDFSCLIERDARIGIVGKNGCGKSTLLNIIRGVTAPDSGHVEIGETVQIGYFSQEYEEVDQAVRAIDHVRAVAELIRTPDGTITAAQMMERFLFPPELQYAAVSRLSGGERRRLALLRVLMAAPNILLFDEPTNDLDVETLAVLEDYFDGFAGAVIAVSHDRCFLDKVADRIYAFEEDGAIRRYNGGYTAYAERREAAERAGKAAAAKEKPAARREPAPAADRTGTGKAKAKFTYKEQQEYDTIEQEIEGLEAQLQAISSAIDAAASDFEALQSLTAEREALEAVLDARMARWLQLGEMAERMKRPE